MGIWSGFDVFVRLYVTICHVHTHIYVYIYTYILVHIYTYTHICVARQTVLLLLQFAHYLGHMVSFDDILLTYMTICI